MDVKRCSTALAQRTLSYRAVLAKSFLTLPRLACLLLLVAVASAIGEPPPLQELPVATENSEERAALRVTAERYTRLMWGVYHQSRGQKIAAVKAAYDALIAEGMKSSLVYTQRAAIRYNPLQDIRGAEADSREAIALNPENVEATWILARIVTHRAYAFIQSRNQTDASNPFHEEMHTLLERVIELDPDHVDAYRYRGAIGSQFGDMALAISAYKELTRIEPFRPEHHEQLAELYEAQGQTTQAIQSYERVVTILPGSARVRNRLGELYLQEQDYEKAIVAFRAVLDVIAAGNTDNFGARETNSRALAATLLDAHYGSGIAYERMGNFQKSEFHLTEALALTLVKAGQARNRSERAELHARLANVRYALGLVYLQFAAPQKALDIFGELLATDKNHVGALYGSGSAHQRLGNLQQAENYLRRVVALDADYPDASNALGYLYAEQGINLDEAAALVQQALKTSPTSGAYLDSLGFIYFKQGKLDDAIEMLEEANRQLPDTPDILLHLGDAYLEKGLKEKAMQTLERGVKFAPEGSDIAAELREKLESLHSD